MFFLENQDLVYQQYESFSKYYIKLGQTIDHLI